MPSCIGCTPSLIAGWRPPGHPRRPRRGGAAGWRVTATSSTRRSGALRRATGSGTSSRSGWRESVPCSLVLVAVEVRRGIGRDLERPRAPRRSSWPCRRPRSSARASPARSARSARLPSSSTWPCETSWRAWLDGEREARGGAPPCRGGSRGWRISSSPVTPLLARRLVVVAAHLALAHAVDRAELLLLDQTRLVLGDALAAAAVLAGRVGSLVRRAVGSSAERRADAATGAVLGSDLVHGSPVILQPVGCSRGPGRVGWAAPDRGDVAESDRRAARTVPFGCTDDTSRPAKMPAWTPRRTGSSAASSGSRSATRSGRRSSSGGRDEVPDPVPAFELPWMGLPPGSTTDDTAMARNLWT